MDPLVKCTLAAIDVPTAMSIRIQVIRKRRPHPHHQLGQLYVFRVSQRSNRLLGVAKYEWNLPCVSFHSLCWHYSELTSEKWLTPIVLGVVLNFGASHLYE